MSLIESLKSRVSDADWQRMSKHAGIPAEELKVKLLDALSNLDQIDQTDEVPAPQISAVKSSGNCHTQSFSVSLFKVIGISGDLTLCGTNSSNWTAELKVCLIVAGSKVWCTSYQFDPHNLKICYSPSVGLAKADLCFNLKLSGNKACLNVSGKACVWGFGWRCGNFNKSLFCLPIP